MPTPVFGGRPDLDQHVGTLPLFITGTLPSTAPVVAYEGRLQINNPVGACQVAQVAGDTLPPGHQLYVDQATKQVVLSWPAFSASVTPLANAGFDTGDTSGWSFEFKGGAGATAADATYRFAGSHSLRFTGAKGLGSEGGVECSAVNNTIGVAFPSQKVAASVRGMYNPAGHNFGCRYQARLRWLDGVGATISESLGDVIKGRGNNGDWVQASVQGVAPAGTKSVQLVGWLASKGPPTWMDAAQWNLPTLIGIDVGATFNITLRVRDSGGREAFWTGPVVVFAQTHTWNPADSDQLTFSPDLLTINNATANRGSTRSTSKRSTGKWYVEIAGQNLADNSQNAWMALSSPGSPLGTAPSYDASSAGIDSFGMPRKGGVDSPNGRAPSPRPGTGGNAVTMFAWDADAGLFWIGVNGGWLFGGNPGSGANPLFTAFTGEKMVHASIQSAIINPRYLTIRPHATGQSYSAPAGFTPWGDAP